MSTSPRQAHHARVASLVILATCALSFAPATARADEPPVDYDSLDAYYAPPPVVPISALEIPPEEDGPFAPGRAIGGGGKRAGKGTKRAGMILTFAGLGVGVLGAVIASAAASSKPRNDDLGLGQAGKDFAVGAGAFLGIAGGAGMLVGIPLWATGAAGDTSSP